MKILCCQSSMRKLWRAEPWGYPARPQNAILSLKFPAGNTNPVLTRTYRLLFALGWTFWIFYSAFGDGINKDWFIYVTHWTAFVMGSYMWMAFLSTLLPHIQRLDTAAWFLQGIAAPLSVMVTVLFWATEDPNNLPSGITTIHLHGINAVLMLLDLALSRYPYQLKHFPAPLGFILSYLAFNLAYWAETRVVVYPSLNYDKPIGALIMICATIFGLLPASHLLLWRFELACFTFSEHRRYARAGGLMVKEQQDAGAGPSKAVASARPELMLSDVVLATRQVVEVAKVMPATPSTAESTSSEASSEVSAGGEAIINEPLKEGGGRAVTAA